MVNVRRSTDDVDAITANTQAHSWQPLFEERYPHAGGPQHCAGGLENSACFKAEVVADAS